MLPFMSLVMGCAGDNTDQILTRSELSLKQRRARCRQTPHIAITKRPHSSFLCLLNTTSGNEQAALNQCGTDHHIFNRLLDCFKPTFNDHCFPDSKTGVSENETNINRKDGRKTQGVWCHQQSSCACSFLAQDPGICCESCAQCFLI